MTRPAARPGTARWRRGLWLVSLVVGLVAVVALVLVPLVLRAIGGRLLAGEWGGPATVEAATWNFGRELRLRGARAYVPGQVLPMAQVERAVLVFERSFLSGNPGKLMHGVFEQGVLVDEGRRISYVERVEYDARGTKLLRISGIDGDLERGRESAWVEVITRITDAPGVRSDGKGTPLERIEVHETAVRVLFPRAHDEPIPLPIHGLAATLHMEGPKTIVIEDVMANLFGGQARGFGRVDWSGAADWHVQMNLVDVNLARAAEESGALPKASAGLLSAFLDLAQPGGAADLAGAGWIAGRGICLWDQPVMAGLLRTLGLTAGPKDAMSEMHGRVRVDLGHVYADELIAQGTPINLFGTGGVRLDGEELDVRFVPRLFSKDLGGLPVVGKPTQVLLDIVNGQLVEVRLTGSLSKVEVQVNPIAVISAPLRAFVSLFSGDGK